MTMTKSQIEEYIKKGMCPACGFCPVHTTGYDEDKRHEMCLRCWLGKLAEDEIEVVE